MSVCSELSLDRRSIATDETSIFRSSSDNTLPVLPHYTSSASRKNLLKKEFQKLFGHHGDVSREYGKVLNMKKKPSVAFKHATRVLEYDILDRWLRKRNYSSKSTTEQLMLSSEEFVVFFKWFDMKMKRNSYEDGLNIDYVINDFVASGLFKQRAEASHFLKCIDKNSNGSISCEEFMEGLSSDSNLHRVAHFKRFIKKIKVGETLRFSLCPLPDLSRPSTSDSTMSLPRRSRPRL